MEKSGIKVNLIMQQPKEALRLSRWCKLLSLLDMVTQREATERSGARRAQVGTGERSEKIRTYNFPQARLTDHRAGITLHRLPAIIEGDLDAMLDAVHGKLAADALERGSQ